MIEMGKQKTIIIINGLLIDGTGKPPIKEAIIEIKGSRINFVGKKGTVKIPKGSEVIDAVGKTIMPGMIDAHVHLVVIHIYAGRCPVYRSQCNLLLYCPILWNGVIPLVITGPLPDCYLCFSAVIQTDVVYPAFPGPHRISWMSADGNVMCLVVVQIVSILIGAVT